MHARIEVMESNLAEMCRELGGDDFCVRDSQTRIEEEKALGLQLAQAERNVALAKADVHKAEKSGDKNDKAGARKAMKAGLKALDSAREAVRANSF